MSKVSLSILCIAVCYSSKVGGVPVELYERIASWTINDTALMITKATYCGLSRKIDATKELYSIIDNIDDSKMTNRTDWPWNTITNLTQKLQLFEPYHNKRNQLFHTLINKIPTHQYKNVYRAFHVRALTISQYRNLTICDSFNLTESARKKLKIWIGASRALCHPFSTKFTGNESWNENDTITQPMQGWMADIHKHFPWIIKPRNDRSGLYLTFLIHYLWNNYQNEMRIPSSDAVSHLCGDEDDCQFLVKLMARYDFIIRLPAQLELQWRLKRGTINASRLTATRRRGHIIPGSVATALSFIFEVIDAERLNEIFLVEMDADFRKKFMTQFVVQWAERMDLGAPSPPIFPLINHATIEYAVDMILELMWYQYNKSGECCKLLEVLKCDAFEFHAHRKLTNAAKWSPRFRYDMFFATLPHFFRLLCKRYPFDLAVAIGALVSNVVLITWLYGYLMGYHKIIFS